MDMCFMGDVGKMFDRLVFFVCEEFCKQVFECVIFWYMINEIGDYEEFLKQVDKVNNGGFLVWGFMRVREILFIGFEFLVFDLCNEIFCWGVGEEVDVIMILYCNDVNKLNSWVFKEWIYGFKKGVQIFCYYCLLVIMCGSRMLFLVIY